MKIYDGFKKFAPYIVGLGFGAGLLIVSTGGMIADTVIDSKYDKDVENSKASYTEFFDQYDEYTTKVANNIASFNDERDFLRDYAYYVTMLENGCISFGTSVNVGDLPYQMPGAIGANVASGVCKSQNTACNVVDVFTKLGYEADYTTGEKGIVGSKDKENVSVAIIKDGDKTYLVDPLNGNIYLRRNIFNFYDIVSGEDTYIRFKPSYSANAFSKNDNELVFSLGNDFKDHYKVLKQFKLYLTEAKNHIEDFYKYESRELYGLEKHMRDLLIEIGNRNLNESSDPSEPETDISEGREIHRV